MISAFRSVTLAAFLTLSPSGCLSLSEPGDDHTPTGTYRVLMIGNSLTYQNQLPALLEALADSAGVEDLYVQMIAFPDYALEDHVARGDAVRAIRRGNWRYVVMQQGPSALPSSRDHLVHWSGILGGEVRKVGARPALYAVWPSQARSVDFDAVHESYGAAAAAVDGALLPAGRAWQAAWSRDPALALYGPDAFHPSVMGTYLAALVMLKRFYPGLSLVGLPGTVRLGSQGPVLSIPDAGVRLLQEAAEEAHAAHARAGN